MKDHIPLIVCFLQTTFSDIGPYMILSEASVEDLNTRLEKKVTMLRFRPNIAITGCSPYDEVIRLV